MTFARQVWQAAGPLRFLVPVRDEPDACRRGSTLTTSAGHETPRPHMFGSTEPVWQDESDQPTKILHAKNSFQRRGQLACGMHQHRCELRRRLQVFRAHRFPLSQRVYRACCFRCRQRLSPRPRMRRHNLRLHRLLRMANRPKPNQQKQSLQKPNRPKPNRRRPTMNNFSRPNR